MRNALLTVGVFFLCFRLCATSYYVRTDGADANNGLTNSTGGAWKTINKALGASGIPLTNGPHTLNILTGTYTETNQLSLGRAYGTLTTVQPTTGSADVFVIGSTAGNYTVLQSAAISNLWFSKINFQSRPSGQYCIAPYSGSGYTCSSLTFDQCNFYGDPTATKGLVEVLNGASNPAQSYTFSTCSFYAYTTNYPAIYFPGFSYATNCTITMTNCVVYSPYTGAAFLAGMANLGGCQFFGHYNKGLQVGVDGNSGLPVGAIIKSCFVGSDLQHSLLIGAGATNVLLQDSTVYGGNLGLVLKATTGAVVSNTCMLGASFGPFLLKGASNNIVTNCTIVSSYFEPALANYDGDPTYKSGTNTITGNAFIATQSGYIYKWDTNGDNGGNTVDWNTYRKLTTSSYYGYIRANTNVTSIADAISAWSGYSPSGNDQHSRNLTTPVEFASPF